jgi:predicted nuclease of predicted toxin-antitoxin system
MQFLANEDVPLASIRRLRAAGYDVASIIEDSPGVKDESVLSRAQAEQRIILTFDRDYGELIYRRRLPAPAGVAYFRFAPSTPEELADRFIELLRASDITLEGEFTVIGRGWVRQRPLPHEPLERSNRNAQ